MRREGRGTESRTATTTTYQKAATAKAKWDEKDEKLVTKLGIKTSNQHKGIVQVLTRLARVDNGG